MDDTPRLLSWTSHELRTPLNAILGYGQLLELEELTDDQRESVAQIMAAGAALLRIVDDALDFARLRAGELQLSLEPLCVDDALAEAWEAAGCEGAAPRCGATVAADRRRLGQALAILLLQASQHGGLEVSCGAEDGRVRIEVSADAGGMEAERVERLFVPFERRGSTIEAGGLRLPLAKLLVEAMGGATKAALDGGRLLLSVELPRAS